MIHCHPSPLDSTECAQGEKAQRFENRCRRRPTSVSLLVCTGGGTSGTSATACTTTTSLTTSPTPSSSGGLICLLPVRNGSWRLHMRWSRPSGPFSGTTSNLLILLPLRKEGSRGCGSRAYSPPVSKGLTITQGVLEYLINLISRKEGNTKRRRLHQRFWLLQYRSLIDYVLPASSLSPDPSFQGVTNEL